MTRALVAPLALVFLALAVSHADAAQNTTLRSFWTPDSPDKARQVISKIKLKESLRLGVLPPGVTARRTGPMTFQAKAALGIMGKVDARFSITPCRGGSKVTERITAQSMCPAFTIMAGTIHEAAIDIQSAYRKARSRAFVGNKRPIVGKSRRP